jgi:hypothetical protein
MTEDRVTDGVRIAQLLSSELHGRTDGVLAHVAVTDADADVEPSVDGEHAYDVAFSRTTLVTEPDRDVDALDVEGGDSPGSNTESLASVFVHPDRVRVEFVAGVDAAAEAAADTRLRVRPKATTPPRTLAFVESGAAVKDAADVARTVVETLLADDETGENGT